MSSAALVSQLEEIDDWKRDQVISQQQAQSHTEEEAQSPVTEDQVTPVAESEIKYGTDKKQEEFRNYKNSARQERVQNFYHLQHKNQTYDFVKGQESKYLQFNLRTMGIWEALEYLDTFVDDSDPDTDLSQLQHALQAAEACRRQYPGEEFDWFHLVCLIHDLGKILAFSCGDPQWCVVGDTFPVGCKFSEKNVFPEFFSENPDFNHPVYSAEYGIYQPNCGLKNVTMSWGHDEYLYRVLTAPCNRREDGVTIPLQGLYMIRFHSFYPWHKEGAYTHLCDETDNQMLPWVKKFNPFDLYSKADSAQTVEELKTYYQGLIEKYFPEKLQW